MRKEKGKKMENSICFLGCGEQGNKQRDYITMNKVLLR